MNKIPPEILAQVAEEIVWAQCWSSSPTYRQWNARISQYATISRVWKVTVERLIFKFLTRRKHNALGIHHNVNIRFMLPPPRNPLGCCAVVRIPDRAADSVTFSASVAKVFTILAGLQSRSDKQGCPPLCFYAVHRRSRSQEPTGTTEVPCIPQEYSRFQHSRQQVLEARAVSGQFELLREDAIPMLHGISHLEFSGSQDSGDLKTSWISAIVERLPDQVTLHIRTVDEYDYGRNKRHDRQNCKEIALSLRTGDMPRVLPRYHRTPPNPFPSLVEFELQFAAETADGRWFYERDDVAIERSRNNTEYKEFWEEWNDGNDEDDTESASEGSLDSEDYVKVFEDEPFRTDVVYEERFRSRPSSATLLPFLRDASEAVKRVQNLRKFVSKLDFLHAKYDDLSYFPIVSRVFELWLLKAGLHRCNPLDHPQPDIPGDAAYINRYRLYWRVDRWMPWGELQYTVAQPMRTATWKYAHSHDDSTTVKLGQVQASGQVPASVRSPLQLPTPNAFQSCLFFCDSTQGSYAGSGESSHKRPGQLNVSNPQSERECAGATSSNAPSVTLRSSSSTVFLSRLTTIIALDKIPTEILALILDNLPKEIGKINSTRVTIYRAKLAPYTVISQAWRASVERLTFRDLTITTDELDEFAALFYGRNISRRAYLTSLNIVFILPPPRNALGCCPVVRTPDRAADSLAFSESVARLIEVLADIGNRVVDQPLLSLRATRTTHVCHKKVIVATRTKRSLKLRPYLASFELVGKSDLPLLHDIGSFRFQGFGGLRDLKPSWVPKSLIDLNPFVVSSSRRRTSTNTAGKDGLCNESVCGLSTSLRSITGAHLHEVCLNVWHATMKNENAPVHKFVDCNDWNQESWLRMLNHLGSSSFPNLAVLQLRGGFVICSKFFRGILTQINEPFQSLVEFELHFAPETADGKWFYTRDDDAISRSRGAPRYGDFWEEEDDDEEYDSRSLGSARHVRVFEEGPFRTGIVRHDRFRSLPDTTTFLPFLMDASKFVSRIGSLRKFILKLENMYPHGLNLHYYPIVYARSSSGTSNQECLGRQRARHCMTARGLIKTAPTKLTTGYIGVLMGGSHGKRCKLPGRT
ncbi:hypothetical protein EK21DRAFT_91441 [Setomelanomma holmii]|uniref:F-box domain-containing protein n=1 Tax=Setomelanomma holmii TaxID=210430 RepID=A0A9P4LI35_9PLEO|nr:hypothetical protein EK21DRAFT_91441 [Setomelanomma holmii]